MSGVQPKWKDDLDAYLGVKTTFILAGNVHDLQADVIDDGNCRLDSLEGLIHDYFHHKRGYSRVVFYNRIDGFHNEKIGVEQLREQFLSHCDEYKKKAEMEGQRSAAEVDEDDIDDIDSGYARPTRRRNQDGFTFTEASMIMRGALSDNCDSIVLVFNMATSAIRSPSGLEDEEREAFARLMAASKKPTVCRGADGGALVNTLVIVADKVNDIPSWFFLDNPYVKTLSVCKPDRAQRAAYVSAKLQKNPQIIADYYQCSPAEQTRLFDQFANLTDGFCNTELQGLLWHCASSRVRVSGLRQAVQSFRYGRSDNMWDDITLDNILQAQDIMHQRIKGQDHAIKRVTEVLFRAASGLTLAGRASGSNSTKPKGILFLAGPTGTGKTEMAKSITEALFTDESQMIRFDMSEFGKSHSDQRLFGAPPGYVGYEAGGELTNAVREKPFSILLFDEIEKADSSIFDKFLQILDDGRLTDSHGETVYFGQTIIIFTSNFGLSEKDAVTGRNVNVIRPDTYASYDELSEAVLDNIRNPERSIFRPEFINRIGENFIVFDFISVETAEQILRGKLASFAKSMKQDKDYTLYMSWAYYHELMGYVKTNLNNGGRGVVNMLETHFLNPLSKTLFVENPDFGDTLAIRGLYQGEEALREDTFQLDRVALNAAEGFCLTDEQSKPPARA